MQRSTSVLSAAHPEQALALDDRDFSTVAGRSADVVGERSTIQRTRVFSDARRARRRSRRRRRTRAPATRADSRSSSVHPATAVGRVSFAKSAPRAQTRPVRAASFGSRARRSMARRPRCRRGRPAGRRSRRGGAPRRGAATTPPRERRASRRGARSGGAGSGIVRAPQRHPRDGAGRDARPRRRIIAARVSHGGARDLHRERRDRPSIAAGPSGTREASSDAHARGVSRATISDDRRSIAAPPSFAARALPRRGSAPPTRRPCTRSCRCVDASKARRMRSGEAGLLGKSWVSNPRFPPMSNQRVHDGSDAGAERAPLAYGKSAYLGVAAARRRHATARAATNGVSADDTLRFAHARRCRSRRRRLEALARSEGAGQRRPSRCPSRPTRRAAAARPRASAPPVVRRARR